MKEGGQLARVKSLQLYIGQSFEGGQLYLPDVLCTAILEYYAFDAGKDLKFVSDSLSVTNEEKNKIRNLTIWTQPGSNASRVSAQGF